MASRFLTRSIRYRLGNLGGKRSPIARKTPIFVLGTVRCPGRQTSRGVPHTGLGSGPTLPFDPYLPLRQKWAGNSGPLIQDPCIGTEPPIGTGPCPGKGGSAAIVAHLVDDVSDRWPGRCPRVQRNAPGKCPKRELRADRAEFRLFLEFRVYLRRPNGVHLKWYLGVVFQYGKPFLPAMLLFDGRREQIKWQPLNRHVQPARNRSPRIVTGRRSKGF